jgi:hypothetical protein
MPKKACCCAVPKTTTCPWCDYGWGGDQYNGEQIGPVPYSGLTGTITTEIPSIGHPWKRLDVGNCGYSEYRTLPLSPLPGFEYAPTGTYGDLSPAWFNGIDMNQSLDTETSETNAYFKFLFYLQIEKRNDNGSYDEVIKIDWEGYGKNLRPHPDACKSYLLTNRQFIENICSEFTPDDDTYACSLDFAKMPRGPWPYRLINDKIDFPEIDCNDPDIGNGPGIVEICGFNCPTSKDRYCQKCSKCCTEPRNGSNSGDNCFFLSEGGTPYGWEDCPAGCLEFSNYANPEENLHFFSWLCPYSRYTTPEWDVKNIATGGSRKLSIHSLVPNKANVDFCNPVTSVGLSFGEWCFGMDLEAPSEISALESAGFNWSDGREKKGLWIHKTPTNALRVLFTLDHSDIQPGKVFRVFRDWDVENGDDSYLLWDNNEEGLFRIKFKQKVTELAFSSLGCDCPEGNCDTSPICYVDGITPGCHDYRVGGYRAEPCWTCKLSFTERGPMFIKLYPESENSGIIQSETRQCKTQVGTKICPDKGMILFAGPDGAAGYKLYPVTYPKWHNQTDDTPYLNAIGDHPYGYGTAKGADQYRYRSAYIPIVTYTSSYCTIQRDCNDMPPFIYGSKTCSANGVPVQFDGWSTCGPTDAPGCITQFQYPYFLPSINIDPWPSTFPVNKCEQFRCGCPQFGDCNRTNFRFRYKNDDGGGGGGPDAGVYRGEPFEEQPDPPRCGCDHEYYCHENEECIQNLLSPNNYGNYINSGCNSDPQNCYGHGEMQFFCSYDDINKILGIDGNQIVFNASASRALYGGVGPTECAQNCVGQSCVTDDGRCRFCEAGGGVGAGYAINTSIDWRKLLCYRKKSQPGALLSEIIPPNFMSNLEINCDLNDSCDENPLFPDASPGSLCGGEEKGNCDCYFMTSRNDFNGSCNPNYNDEQPLRYYTCLDPDNVFSPKPSYTVTTEPWNDEAFQRKWMYAYPTKFEPQAISQNRVPKYIKINAKGPYTE